MTKGWSMKLSVDAYSRFIVNNPILVIVLSLIWAGIAIYGITNFRFTNDYRYFFSSENPYLTAFEELERTYSSPDTLLYVYQPKDGTKATSAQALQMVEEITTQGWQIPFSTRVDSITNFQNTRAIGEDDLEVRDPDPDKLLEFLAEMEFRTLSKRIADALHVEAPVIMDTDPGGTEVEGPADLPFAPETYERIRDMDALQRWIDRINERGYVAFDTETTGLNEMQADLVGISLAVDPGQACYVPLTHRAGGADDLFGSDDLAEGQLPLDDVLAALKPVLEDEAVLKIGQNMKYDAKILARYGVAIAPIDDTMLMSYAMNAGLHGHGMDTLAERYLGHTPIPIKELIGSGKSQVTFDRVDIDEAVKYAAEDADITLRLWQRFKPQLHQNQVTTVYETLERPLVPVLAQMEMAGIKVDREVLSRMSNAFAQKMAQLEDEIHELAGEKFNVGSPAQVGEILFEKMGLEGGKKAKTGAYSTSADILETLAAEGVEIAAKVLDWRQLSKLKSTYADALVESILPETGRVHTSFSMVGASTGRLSSSDPNVQNIPIRTAEGRQIRTAFVAAEGKKLISADYSQIELRLVAHVAGEVSMIEAFRAGVDIHARTASEVFGVPLDDMDSETRRRAKAINFGIIYGISGFGLARQLGIRQAEARDYIAAYFENFPGIRTYMDNIKTEARETGYVETLFGRRIHINGIASSNQAQRGFAERQAINAPIQGSAADIIKRAMVRLPAAMQDAGIDARMLLQVHDELIFETEAHLADDAVAVITGVMEAAAAPVLSLAVPLVAEAGIADSWADAH
mgnify:CR=1 FL=1